MQNENRYENEKYGKQIETICSFQQQQQQQKLTPLTDT